MSFCCTPLSGQQRGAGLSFLINSAAFLPASVCDPERRWRRRFLPSQRSAEGPALARMPGTASSERETRKTGARKSGNGESENKPNAFVSLC